MHNPLATLPSPLLFYSRVRVRTIPRTKKCDQDICQDSEGVINSCSNNGGKQLCMAYVDERRKSSEHIKIDV